SFCLRVRRLPPSPLFPYTTLFRSRDQTCDALSFCSTNSASGAVACFGASASSRFASSPGLSSSCSIALRKLLSAPPRSPPRVFRSEEHTSELQSRENLVCRLLLEN